MYSDLCGPMKVKTLGGALYFLTFLDDHSQKVWAYALKSKDQVLDMFQQFQESWKGNWEEAEVHPHWQRQQIP